jgi:hypothetical protein
MPVTFQMDRANRFIHTKCIGAITVDEVIERSVTSCYPTRPSFRNSVGLTLAAWTSRSGLARS